MEKNIRRGDIYYASLHHGIGSEQGGDRPVLVIQNNAGNQHSQTVIVAILTGKLNTKARLPTHCYVKAQQGLCRDSLVLLEQLRTIDKTRLRMYVATLNERDIQRINQALSISIGLDCRRT